MPRCPNCGQNTERTEDWACPWCGYPLLSGGYKKIDKTYRQLQEESRQQMPEAEETEVPLPDDSTPAPTPVIEAEPEPERPVEEIEPELAPEPEPVAEIQPEPEAAVAVPEPALEAPVELEPDIMGLTVDQLIAAYAEDAAAADTRFGSQYLRITGIVSRVEITEVLDVHYIILASSDQEQLQSIRCVFDKKYEPELSGLEKGQEVTVQGKYEGSLIDFRMKDCVIAA